MNYLIWTEPTGQITVTSLVRDDDTSLQDRVVDKLLRDGVVALGSTWQVIHSKDDLTALIPYHPDGRAAWDVQHQWRKHGDTIVIDPTVPTPPRPRRELQARLEAANTLTELKKIIQELL